MPFRFSFRPEIGRAGAIALELLAVGVVYLLISGGLYSILAPWGEFSSAIVYGDAFDATYFLAWGHHTLESGAPGALFDLPISHPLPKAGGLTDIVPGVVWLTWPLRLFSDNPLWIFNASRVVFGAATALSFYILIRALGLGRTAAFLTGVSFAFSGFMYLHARGHITMFALFPLPLALACQHRACHTGKAGWIAAASALLLLQGACSSRLGILCLFTLLVALAGYGGAPWRRCGWKPALLPVGYLLAVFGVSLIYRPALELREMIPSTRDVMHAVFVSADPAGYLTPPDHTLSGRLAGLLFDDTALQSSGVVENRAYWGWPVYIGALAGLWAGRKPGSTSRLPWTLLAVVGITLSLGPFLWINGELHNIPLPWYGLLKLLPPLETFRAVARFSLLAGVGLNVLCAIALSRAASRRVRFPAGLFAVALAVDLVPATRPDLATLPQNPDIQAFLSGLESGDSVIHLPYVHGSIYMADHYGNFAPMANSTAVGTRNPYFIHLLNLMETPTTDESVAFLRRAGIDFVIAREPGLQQRFREDHRFEPVTSFAFRITGSDPEPAPITREEIADINRRLVRPEPHATFTRGDQPFLDVPLPSRKAGWNWNGMAPRSTETPGLFEVIAPQPYLVVWLHDPVPADRIDRLELLYRLPDTLSRTQEAVVYWSPVGGWFNPDHGHRVHTGSTRDWQVLKLTPADSPHWPDGAVPVQGFRFDAFHPAIPGSRVEVKRLRIHLHSGGGTD